MNEQEWKAWKKEKLQELEQRARLEGWYCTKKYWELWDDINFADFYEECRRKKIKLYR